MLAIKINTVSKININSSSSADRRKGTRQPQHFFRILPIKVILHFKISWLATLRFKGVLKENKEKKTFTWHWRNSKEIEDWKKMEGKWRDRWKLHEHLKLGDYLLVKFKKLSIFKMNLVSTNFLSNFYIFTKW